MTAPLIIATRVFCKDCQIERLHPFDKNGISHEQLYLRKPYIKCDECNKSYSLEFYPIFQGENLLEVTNKIIKENDIKTRAKIAEVQIDHQIALSKNKGPNLTRDQFEQELIKKYHFKATKDTEDLYYYDKSLGIYVKGGEWLIKRESLKYDPGINTAAVEQIKAHIIWGNYVDRSDFDSKIEWLCCKNVMVNLLTGETRPHSPDFMATVLIPHTYLLYSFVPSPTKIMEFFNQVMGSNDIETILDFMAYCLWRDFPFHRWLLLNGSGRNGKGVTTNLITRLLGTKNVSNETLQRIGGDGNGNRFASANLYGKMANIDADLSSQALRQTGLLKKITGADEIPGEFKFKPAFSFRNYAKLIFSANTIPTTPDETDAFFVRLLIINFPNQFLREKANPNLLEELTTENEMSALLSQVVKRLSRVLKDGISYAGSHTIEENYLKYMRSSDPIRYFVETALRREDEVKANISIENMYAAYTRFSDRNRLTKESSQTFSRELKKHNFYKQQIRIGGKSQPKVWVWRNVRLIDWENPEDDDQEVLDL